MKNNATMQQGCKREKGIGLWLQQVGKFLAGMILPNIGAFIAWGILKAFAVRHQWMADTDFDKFIFVIGVYLLPILVGYTGGHLVYDRRGGVVGAIATLGVTITSSTPLIAGAMIIGPLAAGVLKKIDIVINNHVREVFFPLLSSLSTAFVGLTMALAGLTLLVPLLTKFASALGYFLLIIIRTPYLPFISLIIEPAKTLFLNNLISFGVFMQPGLDQVHQNGQSILFLLDSSPGPGLGLLLAHWLVCKQSKSVSNIDEVARAPSSVIIHFIGGIHETYFLIVYNAPVTILGLIIGGASGIAIFQIFQAGLVAPAVPGSVIIELMMAAPRKEGVVLSGIFVGMITSFVINFLILKSLPNIYFAPDSLPTVSE